MPSGPLLHFQIWYTPVRASVRNSTSWCGVVGWLTDLAMRQHRPARPRLEGAHPRRRAVCPSGRVGAKTWHCGPSTFRCLIYAR